MFVRKMLCAAGTAALLTSTLASPARAQQSPDWTACFASQQDPDAGVRGCTAIITAGRERGRNLAIAYNNRGDAYWEKNDLDRALADYNQAIRADRAYATAFVNRGLVWRDKNDVERAIADFSEAIRLAPRYAFAFNNRGIAFRSKGDLNRAVSDFGDAIRLDPNYALAYHNRANARRDMGDLDRAIADYGEAIRLNPGNAALFGDRGFVQFFKGDFEQAIADYSEVIRIDPAFAPAFHFRGNAYRAMSDFDHAIADYTQAIRLDPENGSHYSDRGYAHFYKGTFAAAAKDFGRANEGGDNPYRMLFRYLALAGVGENGNVELAASAAKFKTKDWPYALFELMLGQQSTETVMAAATRPAQRCEANFYVGEWYLIRGNREQARELLQKAADGCAKTFYEHAAAVTELKRVNR
jgi:tetratricopeptide (TPR) repeat protein